ncbi:YMGG-like glycine zipper-containing protein [Sphingomicrobium nitratireducens]|uniref:YMGG-like glycine zipper-containing protein n=1 Tax=Sphingomicrobium nitratireducens TaxID=2964666 RepID=UPI00224026AE|nr:YMGG-like glycine zipper-containing protein [Sphingomicrobium nitratireducens]
MKKLALTAVLATGLSLTACASDRYGYGDPYRSTQTERAAKGAAIGAAAGAVAGAVIPGVSTVEGAVAGAVLGGVAGAVIKGKQYYRDTRGYCYYVDSNGNPVYDYEVTC